MSGRIDVRIDRLIVGAGLAGSPRAYASAIEAALAADLASARRPLPARSSDTVRVAATGTGTESVAKAVSAAIRGGTS